jgi:hypothetical protein
MVSFTLLTTATLAVLAAASPALKLRRDDCQPVRDAIEANNYPCTEVGVCEFCCLEWFSLADAYGDPPCHEDHGDFECPAGQSGYHCGPEE